EGGLRACQINHVFKRAAMRYAQSLEAQSIYYFPPKRTTPLALQTFKKEATRINPSGRGKSFTA
ncbi:TPA: hypothetical protein ACFM0G_002197, partial [Neisseria meningitidis]